MRRQKQKRDPFQKYREMAANMCGALAHNRARRKPKKWLWSSPDAAREFGAHPMAAKLVHLAWAESVLTAPDIESHTRYAEAEALIRTGWTPRGYL